MTPPAMIVANNASELTEPAEQKRDMYGVFDYYGVLARSCAT